VLAVIVDREASENLTNQVTFEGRPGGSEGVTTRIFKGEKLAITAAQR
jgi:hypothetical protein